ncbi:MAG: diadenylate cyclase [Planctomycetota bacterium]|nr:diadenylate cyclase [Planctomycetota bacterium]
MNPVELVQSMRVIELASRVRTDAMRELVDAVDWAQDGVLPGDVVQALEEREATAQTVVDEGLALPHAMIEWDGEFHIVLGRSQAGVEYAAKGDAVRIIVLLVVGNGRAQTHLELLAAVAALLQGHEFRQNLSAAENVDVVRQLLAESAVQLEKPELTAVAIPRQSLMVACHAVQLAESLTAQALLLAMDHGQRIPWEPLNAWPGRLLVITAGSRHDTTHIRPDTHVFDIAHASLSRMDRANLGLLLAAANGLVDHDREVVCITGSQEQPLDSITVTRPAAHFAAVFSEPEGHTTSCIAPAVILRVLSLAIELAAEGREAHPIGAAFVIGDTRQVIRHTQQLVLNPFHGFARRLRNIQDPSLTETVKEFALIDGAFVVEADGSIRSAGTYLTPTCRVKNLAGGLGSRHQAAAAITAETRAIAVTVSQSTGTVTLFQGGHVVLTLERAAFTRW